MADRSTEKLFLRRCELKDRRRRASISAAAADDRAATGLRAACGGRLCIMEALATSTLACSLAAIGGLPPPGKPRRTHPY
jgi:hypothetical protein